MKPVVASTAYLLISHGSRDSRPHEAMNRLSDLVRRRLEGTQYHDNLDGDEFISQHLSIDERIFLDQFQSLNNEIKSARATALLTTPRINKSPTVAAKVIVGTACLELAAIPLREQIYEFGLRLKAAGVTELKLLPVFLMSGVHVMEDIPTEVAAAREKLKGDEIELKLCPHLGSHPSISKVLANRLASVPTEGSLLVAHGSRRPRGNRAIASLAKRVGTAVAYWATPPDLESQVIELMQQGCQRLTILPYFLFAGGITDAITHRTEELAERFPRVSFRLLPTLGATDEVARLAVELARQ